MPLVPGLSPSIRMPAPPMDSPDLGEPEVIIEQTGADNGDVYRYDERGRVVEIKHPDGDVTFSYDGSSLVEGEDKKPKDWFDNLVEEIDESELSRICEDLMRGIDEDIESRTNWIEERAKGMRLLGMKMEASGKNNDSAPVEGQSSVHHPLMQEAVLRFQANARSEMLPTDGPVKIRNDSNNSTTEQDSLSDKLEKDFNHYLTVTATEFYPDTDRMLLMLGFGGTSFKKVYFCPLRNRPVSEHVDANDLIVNDSATDLANAKRITHRVSLRPSTVRRLQILGVYRDVDLNTPLMPTLDAVQREKKDQQGVQSSSTRPDDRDREIYECYCELDVRGYEHKLKGKETGLEIPYRVTIDVSSRMVLSLVRNYDEETKDLPEAKRAFVKYVFVPGFGFYDIGLLHILGNTTNALTTAWRELLDLGMFANFPGFLIQDFGQRQNTNIIRVPPGGGAPIKTNGIPIKEAVMPLPYSMGSAPSLMALVESMAETGMRVGGTSEQPVGEGRSDAPVGTTLALIEQSTKILNSVHKRMHAAQAEELQLMAECFKEHPDSFWQKNRRPAYPWDEQTFLQALDDCNLVPQADPNTASQVQRFMKAGALKALQASAPTLYDPIAIERICLRALGYSNPDEVMAPASAMANPPPELVKMQQEGQAKVESAQAQTKLANIRAAEVQAKMQIETMKIHADIGKHQAEMGAKGQEGGSMPLDVLKAKTALMDAHTRAKETDARMADAALTARNSEEQRRSDEHLAAMSIAKEAMIHQSTLAQDNAHKHADMTDSHLDRMMEHGHRNADREADMRQREADRKSKEETAKAAAKNKAKAP